MEIGEALKTERIRLGLTQDEMIKGIITKGHYSKIERGIEGISAESLFKILFANHIDADDFLNLIKDTYSLKEDIKAAKLNAQMRHAFDHLDHKQAKKYLNQILRLEDHRVLKYQSVISVTMFEAQLERLSSKFKNEIIQEFTGHNNWKENIDSIRLLGNCMQVFSIEQLDYFVQELVDHYSEKSCFSEKLIERVAIVCNNYLYYCYYFQVKGKKVDVCLKFLKGLDDRMHFMFYRIASYFYGYLFEGKKDKARQLKDRLITWGYGQRVLSWKI